MNPQIKKLWTQAGGSYTRGNQHEWPSARIDDPEKFAELIVKECISIVAAGGEFASRPKLVEKLQEHFGVEQ
jgi:2,4-dienoyl-CoA reductase-like NADH-dependent reductase (Old Yellow Enzyme family)